jgi:HD-like signal output (HDOD) protein
MAAPSAALAKLLENTEKLPAMPAVAAEVLRLSQDADCSIDALVKVIALDPSLSGRLLKLANGASAGTRTPVTQLSRAAILLGMRSVKLMASSCSIASAFPKQGGASLDLRALWRRSVVRAAAARGFASHAKSALADEAFLCGLLSHIGRLVLAQSFPGEYREIVRRASGSWPEPAHERGVFGFDGFAASAALLRHWSLPSLLCDAIELSAKPRDQRTKPAAELAEVAKWLDFAAHCEELVCGNNRAAAMEVLEELAESELGIDRQALEGILLELESGIAQTADLLELRVQGVRMHEILEAAQLELVRESLGLASDLAQLEDYAGALEQRSQELAVRATTDSLTGIPNRTSFDAFLQRCMDEAALSARPTPFGVLMLDVDHFKRFNDKLRSLSRRRGPEARRADAAARRARQRDQRALWRRGIRDRAAVQFARARDRRGAAAFRGRARAATSRGRDALGHGERRGRLRRGSAQHRCRAAPAARRSLPLRRQALGAQPSRRPVCFRRGVVAHFDGCAVRAPVQRAPAAEAAAAIHTQHARAALRIQCARLARSGGA